MALYFINSKSGVIELADFDDFDDFDFVDEPIRPRVCSKPVFLPPILARARAMEKPGRWKPPQAIFLRQAKLLKNYADDYVYDGEPYRSYPTTYQSLNDDELRGYFSWRTRVRKGEYCPGNLPFIFLYIYELLNQIGVSSPMHGYEMLMRIKREYGTADESISYYLDKWLVDYVIYYNLDKSLLADSGQFASEQCVGILERVDSEKQDAVIDAVKQLARGWLSRSKFYAAHHEDMDIVLFRVLKRMSKHYAKRCKKSFVERLFGSLVPHYVQMFNVAIFCDPLKRRDYEYAINDQCVYKCARSIWTVCRRVINTSASRKLENIIKTVDSIMRLESGYGHPVKKEISVKFLLGIITDEVRAFLAEKAAKAKKIIAIDMSQLEKIRADAAITRERLIVDEESDEPVDVNAAAVVCEQPPAGVPENENPANSLSPEEKRLLLCLLDGGDLGWLKKDGHMLSVLVDGINEKLYDIIGDSVLDDTPQLVEDYIDDIKELIQA